MKPFLRFPLLVATCAAILTAGNVYPQVCNLGTRYFFDKSGTCPGPGRETCNTGRMYLFNTWNYGGKRFLIGSTYSNAIFYDVSDPTNVVQALDPGPYQPWGQGEADSSPDDDRQQWDVALLDDYQYGLAMFQNYGWATFRVNVNPATGNPTGFSNISRFRRAFLPTSSPASFARLFRGGDQAVYAVGSWLNRSNNQVVIVPFTNGVIDSASAYTLPGVGARDPLETLYSGGKYYLFAFHNYSVTIFDLSSVTASALTNPFWSLPQVGGVGSGASDFFVDKDNRRLLMLNSGNAFTNPPTPGTVSVFSVADPANPSQISTVTLDAKSYTRVAGWGGIVVVAQPNPNPAPWVQAFSIANPNAPFEVARGQLDPAAMTDEIIQDLWVAQGGTGDMGIYEAAFSAASMTRLSAACLSLDPVATFTVTGGAVAATCPATPTGASAGIADEGFSGDTFTIDERSYGEITGKDLTITRVSDSVVVFHPTWSPLAGWSSLTWASQTSDSPGEYWVTMTLSPAVGSNYTKTQSIFLCGNPAAALAITQGAQQNLVGDSINVSAAATTGHPNVTTPYSFYVIPQGGTDSALAANGSTLASPYTLSAQGTYTFGVVAHYDFAVTDAASCSGVPAGYLTPNYDSCTSVQVTADNGVSLFEVWQNGQMVANTANPGNLLVNQPTTLKFTGKVASQYAPNFVWSIPGGTPAVPSHLTCTFTAPPYTNTTCEPIAAGTWGVGQAFDMNMQLQVCNGATAGSENCAPGGTIQETINAPTVTVTPSLYSFTFHVTPTNPNIGQDVTITLDTAVAPPGGFTGLTFNLGGEKCAGGTFMSYQCGSIFGTCTAVTTLSPKFQYAASAAGQTLTITGTATAGATQIPASNTPQVTVGTTGSCGPLPLTLNPSPNHAQVGSPITFSIDPTLSHSGDSAAFDFGDNQHTTLPFPCPPLVGCTVSHQYSSAGDYTVNVTATIGGGSYAGSDTVTITSGGGGGNLSIVASPNPASQGSQVAINFTPKLTSGGDSIHFTFGDGQSGTISFDSLCQILGGCGTITHTYSTSGTMTITGSGTVGGGAVSGSATITIQNNCQYPGAPVADFTFAPNPANATRPVQFTDASTGTATAWSWNFGDAAPLFGGGTSNLQNPVYTYSKEGTYVVTLTASNCRGSSQKQLQVVVGPSCTETAPPVADLTWGPQGALASYPQQQQPYVGQQVTLTDASTNHPTSWHWYDFQEGTVDATVTSSPFTYAWTQAGDKNVRMTATNCFGTSSEVVHTVHVYDDIRLVTADFSWAPTSVATGTEVTFTAAEGPSAGDPDTFTWTFDDGSTQTGAQVTYTFKCGGNRRVTLAARRSNYNDPNGPATVAKTVEVSGETCGPESVMAVDAAKVQGLNDTNWHADVRIYNPSAFPTSITLQFLPVGKDNFEPFAVGPYQPPLPPRGTLVLDDILQWLKDTWGQDFSKTALRFTYRNEDNVAPVVLVRTYNLRPDLSKYGQINPGVNVVPGSTLTPLWLTGLHNNGLTDGFRTNYSIVNLQGDQGGVGGITFTLFDETGTAQGSKTFGLAPYGYIQDSIKNLFGPTFDTIGTFSIKIDVPEGKDIQVYASVMDNHTGDPVMIPAAISPDSPIYLPAMAHNAGEANTVWRTDLQITNPDSNGAHTWEVRYTPKTNDGLPVVVRSVTLASDTSLSVDDLVEWAYSGLLPADAPTSGIVRIVPTDGSAVYPIVSARSYNLTSTGTFGQGIPPLWADKGITPNSQNRRLVLTGMSSEDIARTNLGFVNLSETQGVNFVVYFYDESGTLLNPRNPDDTPKPYTFAIGPGTWDQDKLENRFRNAFKTALPSNLRAISAEISVNDGGPGFVYASLIDAMTGDPNFIPAQPAP